MYSDDTKTKAFCGSCGAENLIVQDVINIHNTTHNTTNHHTQQTIHKTIIGKEQNEAEDYIRIADEFMSLGEIRKSRENFQKALDTNPTDYRGWFGMYKTNFRDFKMNTSDLYSIGSTVFLGRSNYTTEKLSEIYNLLSKAFFVADETAKEQMRQDLRGSGYLEYLLFLEWFETSYCSAVSESRYHSTLYGHPRDEYRKHRSSYREMSEKCFSFVETDSEREERIEKQIEKQAEEKRIKQEQEKAAQRRQELEKREKAELQEKEKQLLIERKIQGLCIDCGSKFKGIIVKKCVSCNKKKNY